MRGGAFAVGVLIAVVVLAGCAKSQVDDYRSKANASCADAKKRLGEVGTPASPMEAAKAAEREMKIREEAIGYLHELTVPMHIEGATVVIEDLEARQERAAEIKKVAEEKDEAKLEKLEEEGHREFGVEAQRAKDVGLTDCAEL